MAQELSEQLTNQLCHIPADVVQHVTDMIKQLAANIAQHGQQVRDGHAWGQSWDRSAGQQLLLAVGGGARLQYAGESAR